jgi:ATP diphosphatase
MLPDPSTELQSLLAVMARLRDPEAGCSWDKAQDFASIAPYTIEEAYEVAAEIGAGPEPGRLCDELGDLLLQVVYHARMAEERGWFSFADVAAGVTQKMIRRHPHVFGQFDQVNPEARSESWETQKAAERAVRMEVGTLAGLTPGLPALTRATKLTHRAARVGFDWPDVTAVLDKLEEEAAELRAELPNAEPERLADEVGDLLFVLANVARKLELDPEACLSGANRKFARRFTFVEAQLAQRGVAPADASLAEMELAWTQAKVAGL